MSGVYANPDRVWGSAPSIIGKGKDILTARAKHVRRMIKYHT